MRNEHPIKRYCRIRSGFNQQDFAVLVGLSYGYVNQIVNGTQSIGAVAARKVFEGTGGAISFEELLTWQREPAEDERAQAAG